MKYGDLLERNEKRIYISKYFGIEDEQKEYITIKKLDRSIKKKIQLLSINTISGKTGHNIIKQLKKKGLSIEDLDKIKQTDQLDLMLEFDFNKSQADSMTDMTIELEKMILEAGVDPLKHTIENSKGEKLKLNYEFWNKIGNDDLIEFILNAIKDFSQGFSLGESSSKKSE
jgi:Glu-tRNA(Gln) amidotransferase subunit E-like FAD-binding protein